jgi:hypothetical protein
MLFIWTLITVGAVSLLLIGIYNIIIISLLESTLCVIVAGVLFLLEDENRFITITEYFIMLSVIFTLFGRG